VTPTITAPAPSNAKGSYGNWRPPLVGVSLFVPVGGDALLVAETTGGVVLPVGGVRDGQTPEQAAREVLTGGELPFLREVLTERIQMRRRTVIVHVLAATVVPQEAVLRFEYRDARGTLLVLPVADAISRMPPRARLRPRLAMLTLDDSTAHHSIDRTA